jgi:tetraacyldisaccharide 4'-kinase
MRVTLERFFQREWQRTSAWQLLLRPVSWLFAVLAALRRMLYRVGIFSSWRAAVPVIVVGNISVGGTGKTPVVLALVNALRRAGFSPGIVTRGYATGRTTFSDEAALLIARSGAPLVTNRNRAAAARALLAIHPKVDVIISDDGLQHLALQRDIEICVVDAARGLGNGQLLPAGSLRETAERLTTVTAIVYNETGLGAGIAAASEKISNPFIGEHFQAKMSEIARQTASLIESSSDSASLDAVPVFAMRYANERFDRLRQEGVAAETDLDCAAFLSQVTEKSAAPPRIAAIAGIGHPERFFAGLRALGIPIATMVAFADHHDYTLADLAAIDADILLMTEKDAVKCVAFSQSLPGKSLWQMRVDAVLPDHFYTFIAARVRHVARPEVT